MAQLKPQKFTIESFKDQASWITNLLSPLNQILNDLVMSYSNGLTVSENLYQEIKEITFKNNAGVYPLVFKTKFNANPKGMVLLYNYDNTLNKYATTNPVIEWQFVNGNINITAITGLTSGSSYTVRFLVIYG